MDFIRNLEFRTKILAIVAMMLVPIALLGAFFLKVQLDTLSQDRLGLGAVVLTSAVIAIALVLALTFGWITARMTTDSLRRVIVAIGHIAEGDYTQRVDVVGSDELGQLLRTVEAMRNKVAGVLGSVRQSAQSVATAAGQIDAGTQDLASRTETTAASLEETAASMEQMTSTVRQNADNAGHANQLALAAREQAEEGGRIVRQAVDAMGGISASSRRIADIIAVVDEIAFQTNLLALNASVEAARAGDQGRGFAVVASEVRNLAQRSAKAAREIKELIQDSVTRVEAGSRLVDESGKRLAEIESSVKKVTDIIGEITAASDEQARGVEEVNRAVMDMDQGTQQNAAMVEEATAAAASMSQESRRLAEAVAYFKLLGASDSPSHGASWHASPAAKPAGAAAVRAKPGSSGAAAVPAWAKPSAAKSQKRVPERRSASRPWSKPQAGTPDAAAGAAPAASAASAEEATAGNTTPRKAMAAGEVWDEF